MDKQVVFKTSAIGFDKKSVLDYVYHLNERAEETQALLNDQLQESRAARTEMELQVKEYEGTIQSLKNKLSQAQDELTGERQRANELNDLINAQSAEIEKIRSQAGEKECEAREALRLVEEIKERNRGLESSRAEVDKASTQIGKLLIDAHTDADNIVKSANFNAESIISQATEKSDAVLRDASEQAVIIISEAKEESAKTLSCAIADSKIKIDYAQKAVDTAYEKFSVFRAEISGLQRSVLTALEEIHERAASIHDAIDTVQNNIHSAGTSVVNSDDAFIFELDGEPVEIETSVHDEASDGKEDFFR